MMDLGNITDILDNPIWAEPAMLMQQGQGHRVDGRWVPGPVTSSNISVVTVPPGEAEAVIFAQEGARLNDAIIFYTKGTNINSLRYGADQAEGDTILYQGRHWNVLNVQPWYHFGFSVIMATRVSG